jgi:hypothetical protein
MKRGEADGAARRVPILLAVGAIGTAVCAASLVACSALLDWSGYTSGDGLEGGHMMHMMSGDDAADGPGDSAPDDAGIFADAPPLTNCGGGGLCSPPIPANAPGWSGPYSLSAGAPGSLPTCDTKSYRSQPTFEGTYGLKADPPQCGCSCSRPQEESCDPPKVTFYNDSNCTSECDAGPVNGCLVIPTCGSSGPAAFLEITGTTPSAGAYCAPDAAVAMPATSWTGAARVCQLGSNAAHDVCGSGGYCLPPSTPYCIMFAGDAGDAPCPAGNWYVHKHVFYSGVSDQRGCSSCTCGSPTGASCAFPQSPPAVPPVGSFDNTCTVPLGMYFFAPISICTGRSPSAFGLKMVVDAGVVEAGSCLPSAVAPLEAGAVGTGATTLCCTQ